MDDGVIGYVDLVVKDLLPHDELFVGGDGSEDVEKFLDEDSLQSSIVSLNPPRLHKIFNSGIAVPKIVIYLKLPGILYFCNKSLIPGLLSLKCS